MSINNLSESDKAKEDNIKFVVTSENSSEALDPTKEAFDLILAFIKELVVTPGVFPI